MEQMLFYGFAGIALLAASFVVVTKNSVYAALSLVLTFVMTAVLWIMMEAEFLGITLILVYVGAVMVLFLFVVMMLNIDEANDRARFVTYWPFAIALPILLCLFFIYIFGNNEGLLEALRVSLPHHGVDYNNVKELGMLLYTKYLFAFEIAGFLLLVGIIVAISLTFRGKRNSKHQNISQQVEAQPSERIKLVDGI